MLPAMAVMPSASRPSRVRCASDRSCRSMSVWIFCSMISAKWGFVDWKANGTGVGGWLGPRRAAEAARLDDFGMMTPQHIVLAGESAGRRDPGRGATAQDMRLERWAQELI